MVTGYVPLADPVRGAARALCHPRGGKAHEPVEGG